MVYKLRAFVVCGLWFALFGLRSVVCGLWSVVYCLRFEDCGLKFVLCGVWAVVCALWLVVCGLWFVFHHLTQTTDHTYIKFINPHLGL